VVINRGDRVTASENLLDKFRTGESDWHSPKVHFGILLCGEKLIASKSFLDRLLDIEKEAIGGEMEGSGLYTAARKAKIDWIIVKAISDWADGSKNDKMQPIAAMNAAKYVRHVVNQGGLKEQIEATLFIKGDLSDFKKEELSQMLTAYLPNGKVTVLSVTSGSIRVTIKIDDAAARELALKGINSGQAWGWQT